VNEERAERLAVSWRTALYNLKDGYARTREAIAPAVGAMLEAAHAVRGEADEHSGLCADPGASHCLCACPQCWKEGDGCVCAYCAAPGCAERNTP
jgi:hypothetical protein